MSVKFQDYYSVLGVSRDASKEDLQRAYRKLARKYHPDVNKSKEAEDKFKLLNEANEVLKDPEKRKLYDQLGANWKAGQDFQPPPQWQDMFGNRDRQGGARHQQFQFAGSDDGFSDFFSMLFGNGMFGGTEGAEPRRAAPGRTHEATLTLSIEEAFKGGSKSISLEFSEADPTGRTARKQRRFQVKIPPGVTDGSVIRLAGQGDVGHSGGTSGDLLLRVSLAAHPRYKLSGCNVLTTLPLAPWEAALGTKVTTETLHGPLTVTIPPGSQNGQQLRLKGKGFPGRGKTPAGDMLVELQIVVPRSITPQERELFQKIQEVSTFKPRG